MLTRGEPTGLQVKGYTSVRDQESGREDPRAGYVGKGSMQMERMWEETTSCWGGVGGSWLWGSVEPLTPILCLGASTELSFQQDNQDPGPEEALGEHPLAYLPGAGGGRWPAYHPDCVAGHLSPTEK